MITDFSQKYGVKFMNDADEVKHSYTDFSLIPKTKGMPDPPKVQTEYIDIPGMDGTLDASQALDGLVHYEDRNYSQEFYIINEENSWYYFYSLVMNFLHGRHVRMVMDDDRQWYYEGRLEIGDPKPDESGYMVITITGVLKPYKYNINTSVDDDWLWDYFDLEDGVIREYGNITVEGSKTVDVIGSVMPVVPTITVSSENGDGMTCAYNGTTYSLVDGDNKIPSMIIQADDYEMEFTGYGVISIYYREGSL